MAEQTLDLQPISNESKSLDLQPINIPPKQTGIFDKVSEFLGGHPRINEFLTGTSPQFEQSLKESGITGGIKGPGFMEIPGVKSVFDKIAETVTGSEGNLRLGAGAVVKALGDIVATGFDPKSVGFGTALHGSNIKEPPVKQPLLLGPAKTNLSETVGIPTGEIPGPAALPERVPQPRVQGRFSQGYIGKEGPAELPTAVKEPVVETPPAEPLKIGEKPPSLPGQIATGIMTFPRSIRASWDVSAPFRQGLGLVHKIDFWKNLKPMMESLGSEEAYNALQRSIVERPNFKLGQDSGLFISELSSKLGQREESIMSNLAEKVPGVRASNRAYTSFLNKTRADVFDSLIEDAKRIGYNIEENPRIAQEIAQFVNRATGRGTLDKLEPYAQGLNTIFFSPRLIASRVQTLNPMIYVNPNISPLVRQENLKSLLAIAGAGNIALGLAKIAKADISFNPTNADFMKGKFGNTRLDPWGGYQQYITAANRLITGKSTSSVTGNTYELGGKFGSPTRKDILIDFAANKLNPPLKFAYDILNATSKRPFNIPKETIDLFIPMMAQDVIDIAKDDPKLLPLVVPGAMGMGLQTYDTKK